MRTEGENKEIAFFDAKEKIECAISQFYQACVNTGRKPAYELDNIILSVTDGSVQIKNAAESRLTSGCSSTLPPQTVACPSCIPACQCVHNRILRLECGDKPCMIDFANRK